VLNVPILFCGATDFRIVCPCQDILQCRIPLPATRAASFPGSDAADHGKGPFLTPECVHV
jgi:hypothetical protein